MNIVIELPESLNLTMRLISIGLAALMLKKCLASDVASAAMDGETPESGQDGLLREERH